MLLQALYKATKSKWGFTLAELLISLAILGVIATFTIPKILSSQQNTQYNASGKEVVAMISSAYQQLQMSRGVSDNTTGYELTPYMNYVNVDTSTQIDCSYNATCTSNCGTSFGSSICLTLHNGGKLMIPTNDRFLGTTTTNVIHFYFDPDGKVTESSPSANGPGKNIEFHLFYNGKITTRDASNFVRCSSLECPMAPTSGNDPPWFSWN